MESILNVGLFSTISYIETHSPADFYDEQISSFLGDFSNALTRAKAFDAKVNTDASKISADYASVVALSIRQALGALEITISKNSNGSWNTADVIVFMKGKILSASSLYRR